MTVILLTYPKKKSRNVEYTHYKSYKSQLKNSYNIISNNPKQQFLNFEKDMANLTYIISTGLKMLNMLKCSA